MYYQVEEKCFSESSNKRAHGFMDVATQVRELNQDFSESLTDLNNLLQELRRYSEPTEPSNQEAIKKDPQGSLECLADGVGRYKELANTLRFSIRHLRSIM